MARTLKDNKDNEELGEMRHIREENAVDAPVKDIDWSAQEVAAKSETKLEDDEGHGNAVIIRKFEFSANPEAFREHTPTKQELFNAHYKLIETMLWADGLKVIPEVDPKVTINKKKTKFRIFVGAEPQRGHILRETPQTLSQIANKISA